MSRDFLATVLGNLLRAKLEHIHPYDLHRDFCEALGREAADAALAVLQTQADDDEQMGAWLQEHPQLTRS